MKFTLYFFVALCSIPLFILSFYHFGKSRANDKVNKNSLLGGFLFLIAAILTLGAAYLIYSDSSENGWRNIGITIA